MSTWLIHSRLQIVALAGLLVLTAQPAVAQGRDAPLPGLQGGQLSQGDLLKGTSIVVVWASWSPRSRDIVTNVNAIEQSWGSKARVVTVNFQEDRSTIESFLSGKRLSVPVYLDAKGAFSKKHAVTTLPGLLIYKDGQVAYRGRLPNDVDRLISQVLG